MAGDMVGKILGKGTGSVTGAGVGNIIGKKKLKKRKLGLGAGQTGNATTESVMGNILRK